VFGNLTRIDNELERCSAWLKDAQNNLATVEKQLQAAKEEVGRPFPQAQEYAEKLRRLQEVNIALNIGEKDTTVFHEEPDERDEDSGRKTKIKVHGAR